MILFNLATINAFVLPRSTYTSMHGSQSKVYKGHFKNSV